MSKETITAAQVTPEMMEGWSKKYGEGKCAKVKAEDKVCFLRPPNRTEMGAYSIAYRTNPVKANEYLLKQCWLAGDIEIQSEDRLFYAAAEKLPELVESASAELDRF